MGAAEHLPLGALQGLGLVGHMQDEVEQSQLAHFPDTLQLPQGLLGMNSFIFTLPDLEQLGLRNQAWVMAHGIALELGLKGQGSGEKSSQRWRVVPSGFKDRPSAVYFDLGLPSRNPLLKGSS